MAQHRRTLNLPTFSANCSAPEFVKTDACPSTVFANRPIREFVKTCLYAHGFREPPNT